MRSLATLAALLLAAPANAVTPEYPLGLFEKSPLVESTTPDACDFQHQCYHMDPAHPDRVTPPPAPQYPTSPRNDPPRPTLADPAPDTRPPPAPAYGLPTPDGAAAPPDPWCFGVSRRLFASLGEVQAAHERCDHW